MKLRHLIRREWRSFNNYRRGFAWASVRRCRICVHTTPSHYRGCPRYQESS